MTARGKNLVLVGKCSWLAANLSVWLMGLGSCMTDPYCRLAMRGIVPILCFLSFPVSLLFILVNDFLGDLGFSLDVPAPLYYTFLSLGAITLGYAQWFHVLPRLFGQKDMIVLALGTDHPPITYARDTSSTIDLGRRETPLRRRKQPPLNAMNNQFLDKAGRTPLERVINSKRTRSTNASGRT